MMVNYWVTAYNDDYVPYYMYFRYYRQHWVECYSRDHMLCKWHIDSKTNIMFM